jgi:hypothetical protein
MLLIRRSGTGKTFLLNSTRPSASSTRTERAAGESARVTFELPTDMLCFTGIDGRRIVEPVPPGITGSDASADP